MDLSLSPIHFLRLPFASGISAHFCPLSTCSVPLILFCISVGLHGLWCSFTAHLTIGVKGSAKLFEGIVAGAPGPANYFWFGYVLNKISLLLLELSLTIADESTRPKAPQKSRRIVQIGTSIMCCTIFRHRLPFGGRCFFEKNAEVYIHFVLPTRTETERCPLRLRSYKW
jgi:hypothetical protein